MKEAVFTFEDGAKDVTERFLTAVRAVLDDPAFSALRASPLEVLEDGPHLPRETPEEAEEVIAGVNWVLSCRIPPYRDDD